MSARPACSTFKASESYIVKFCLRRRRKKLNPHFGYFVQKALRICPALQSHSGNRTMVQLVVMPTFLGRCWLGLQLRSLCSHSKQSNYRVMSPALCSFLFLSTAATLSEPPLCLELGKHYSDANRTDPVLSLLCLISTQQPVGPCKIGLILPLERLWQGDNWFGVSLSI